MPCFFILVAAKYKYSSRYWKVFIGKETQSVILSNGKTLDTFLKSEEKLERYYNQHLFSNIWEDKIFSRRSQNYYLHILLFEKIEEPTKTVITNVRWTVQNV
jgi:hypothetical protein